MSDRQNIQDFINQYIVSNSKQWITGEQMNIILNDFASKIKFFKDENSVEAAKFNGMKSFLSDYKFFPNDEYTAVTNSFEKVWASRVQNMYVDQLDADLRFYNPLYFSDVTLEEAKAIIQLQTAIDLVQAIQTQPEMADVLIAYFQQMGAIKINTSYTRAAYIFYASQLFNVLSKQSEINLELASFYLDLIFPPLRVIQTPIEQVCRLIVVAGALRYVTRQPESIPQINRLLSNFGSVNYLDNPMVNVTRNYVVAVLLECISKQPEFADTLKEFFVMHAGSKILFKTIEYQYADGVIMSAFLVNVARQPEMQDYLIDTVNELTNVKLEYLPRT